MGKIGRFVILIFIIYAWALGYCLCTLLKTCEGENLQDCVSKAESMLQDPNMTFPDDNETLQSVCRMWEDMTVCTYNYTSRCLTRKENEEFHQYFQEPMTSMKTVCTDKDSSEEYFRHAHCIKRISTGENYCGTQYQIMIDQILSVTMNSMKQICCAMRDFKECVMKMNAKQVCRGEPYEDSVMFGSDGGDIATYAFRTLDKSLLAFVTHSCVKEGFTGQRCSMSEDDNPNDLSQLMQERTDNSNSNSNAYNNNNNNNNHNNNPPGAQAMNGDSLYGPSRTSDQENEDIRLETAMLMSQTQTQKPLLVPLSPMPYDLLHRGIRVNVTVSGNRGKTFMGRAGPFLQQTSNINNNINNNNLAGNVHATSTGNGNHGFSYGNDVAIGRSLRDKDMLIGSGGLADNHVGNQILEARLRNVSNWLPNISQNDHSGNTITNGNSNHGNTNSNKAESNSIGIALAERRIDAESDANSKITSASGNNINTVLTHGNEHTPSQHQNQLQDVSPRMNGSTLLNSNGNGSPLTLTRVNAGRSLNFLESSGPVEENALLTSSSINMNMNGAPNERGIFNDNQNPTLRVAPPETMGTGTTNPVGLSSPPPTASASASVMSPNNQNQMTDMKITTAPTATSPMNNNNTNSNNNGGDGNKSNSKSGSENETAMMDKEPSPRILNSGSSSSLGTFNHSPSQGTTKLFTPPSTTPTPPLKKNAGKSEKGDKGKKKALLDIANTTMKTDESKNNGNFSVSDVPIKVFMVWLSTFFV